MSTKRKKVADKQPHTVVQNCTFHGNTDDSAARLAIAEAIKENAKAARALVKSLQDKAALLSITNIERQEDK